jgi:dihydrofolate reductase
MRKLFFQIMVSLDGYFEAPDRSYAWHVIDDDFSRYSDEMLKSIDTIVLGRVTYQSFVEYWPTANEGEAHLMNELPKVVFSKTLDAVRWNNARLVKTDVADEIRKLKSQPGRDIALLASNSLATSLMRSGLIDEYRILLAPVVLGTGTPLFAGLDQRANLRLLSAKTFASGVVSLTYAPK